MTKNSPQTSTPRLRFPEFRKWKAWEQRQAGELFTNRIEHGEDGLPIYSVTIDDGMVKRSSLERKVDDIADSEGNKNVHKNDIAYNMMRMWQGAFGVAVEDCMVSPAYVVLTPREGVSSEFVGRLLKTPWSLRSLTSHSHGLTKDRLRLYYKDFAQISLPLPSLAEQKKIADCLMSLDELIAAQGRRVEALKAHKKGLMQQLFPREGETLPRLRFPEFRDKPEWKPTSLDELVDIQSGGTPSKANPAFWNGSVPWVSAKDMKNLFLEDAQDHISAAAIDDGSKLVPAGTLLMLVRGMTLLKDVPICVLRREMCFNQDVKALCPKVDADGLFLAFLLLGNKQRLLKMVDIAGHGTGKLNTDELKALELVSPQPAEQQRIADCLSALDARIAAEADKLAAVKTHKKGLMQQLFPDLQEAVSPRPASGRGAGGEGAK